MRRNGLLIFSLCALSLGWLCPKLADAQGSDTRRLRELLEERDGPPKGRTLPDNGVVLGSGSGDKNWDFPTQTNSWLNSPPLQAEALRGKGIVMLFFEEECAACASQWPELLRISNQYAERPVIFIAVNSGNDARTVRRYAGQARISWPVIVDQDRSFENAMGVPTISMDNVIQVRYIDAEGLSRPGKWSDIPATTEAALEGAKWRVDPTEAPGDLRGAWRSIEIGAFSDAAKAINRAAESKKQASSGFAKKLLGAVQEAMDADLDKVRDALRSNDEWEAYKGLEVVQERYDGYDIPEVVTTKSKELAKKDGIKAQIAAMKSLNKARSTAAKGSASARKRAISMLQRLVSDSPGTEAATEAQSILDRIN